MLKDREEEYHAEEEETEYQFSDEEASYDANQQTAASDDGKQNPLGRLSRSKRMIISVSVFLVLVFVVYKMVAPVAAPDTSTEIVAAPAVPVIPKQTITQATAVAAPASLIAPPKETEAAPLQPTPPAQPQQMQPPVAPMQQAPVSNLPPVIPVQSPNQSYAVSPAPMSAEHVTIDAQVMQMAATNASHIQQLQDQYMQKMNGLESQSKSVQDQMVSLNTRMLALETDINKFMSTINTKAQTDIPPPPLAIPKQPDQPIKLNYTVQAIIPGRAWLRSANGDTVTVAEGDVLQGAGRILKIDPYDGIVQIEVGNKTVSLSYGIGN